MKKYIFLVCMTGTVCAVFDYDRAVSAAQKEQWALAGEKFKSLVTAYPDQPDVLYDAGIVAFKNEDLDQAKALFESAAQHEKAPRELKEQAYFNKGNTHAKQEQLKEALLSYEQALMLNPENEQAKHNVAVVKKMLEQKEQQKQDKQDKNQDKNKDQKDQQQKDQDTLKQDKQDQQGDGGDEQDQGQKDGQQGKSGKSGNGSETSEKNKQKKNEQQQKGDENSLDQEGDQKDDERERPKEEERKPQRQQQRRKRNEPEKNSQKDKQQEQQKKDDHRASLEKDKQLAEQQAQQQNMQAEAKEQDLGKEGAAPIQLDPALERVLARREDRDAQLNKLVIKALVGETAGQHGQNSW